MTYKILRLGERKKSGYVVDKLELKNGKMIWKDKKVSKEEWLKSQ